MTILVSVESPQDTRNAVNLARAALSVRRGQRRCRQYVESSEAAELAARKLAETFEARVEQRTAELAAALNVCSIASNRLSESDERNRAVIEMSDLILFTADAAGQVTRIDDRFFVMTGYPRTQKLSIHSDKRNVHPNDRDRIRAAQIESLHTGKPLDYQYRVRVADGSHRWLHLRARPVVDDQGNVLRWNGTLADINDRKVAQDRLSASEALHRHSTALSDLIAWTATPDGQIETMPDRFFEKTGWCRDDMRGLGWAERLVHVEDVRPLRAARFKTARTGLQLDCQFRICHADGHYHFWRMRAAADRDDAGRVIRWYGSFEDIDELKRAEERLRESELRHRASIALGHLITFTLDGNGVLDSVDDPICRITGFSMAEILANAPDGICHPDDLPRLERARDDALETHRFDQTVRIRQADTDYKWWRLRSAPRWSADGRIIGWFGTMEDVDQLLRAREALKSSEEIHRLSIELSDQIAWSAHADGKIDVVGEGLFDKLGIARDAWLAMTSAERVHPDDLGWLAAMHGDAMHRRCSADYQFRMRCHDGSFRWWRGRYAPLLGADGEVTRWFGTFDDVNELVLARDALKASEELYRLSVELSGQIAWVAGADGRITNVSEGLSDRLGIARVDWLALTEAERVHPDDAETLNIAGTNAVRDRTLADFRVRLRYADGSFRWWRGRAAPFYNEHGEAVHWHGMMEDVDELYQAEEKLRESEERYRFAVQLSNLVTYTVDAETGIVKMDNIAPAASGVAIEKIGAKGSDFIWHPDHLPIIQAARAEARMTGHYDQTSLMDNRDGTYRWWRSRAVAFRDADGRILRWFGTLEDVDELRRAEEKLRESENRHRLCIGLSKLLTYTADLNANILSMDEEVTAATGIAVADIVGTMPTSLCHPDDLEMLVNALLSAREFDNFECTYRISDSDGRYRWWRSRARPYHDESGTAVRWYGTMEDIDELRLASERLRETEELYRYTIELGEQIIVTADAQGKLTGIGPRWTALTGVPVVTLLGDGLMAIMHPDDQAEGRASWAARVSDGAGADFTCRFADAAGNFKWWRLRAAQRRGDDGKIIGWYGTLENVDAVVLAEQQLQQMQAEMIHMSRLNAMGTMASTLAHELNQPLAAVINYIGGSRRLLSRTAEPALDQIADAMRSAEDCALRASEIIRRVRQQVSRGGEGHGAVSAGSLVHDACSIALINARELSIDVVIDLDPAVTTLHAHAIQVQQILINLLRNAVEAVAGQPVRKIVVSTLLVGDHCAFAVNDSGPGVAEAMVARLFEPFETSKAHGLGIGLSICRTIAEANGGKLNYRRSVLGGADFTILLPINPPPSLPRARVNLTP
ncbi:MAG: PAS domain-containing protein [Tardiphaga sp.]|nr:PAS domain-containing protein [Tardiphaga sp.]